MTTTTTPIDPSRFAAALPDLPLDSLHAKAAEIQNSITHLKSSNEQMLPFADEGDQDCKEAMYENLRTIGRMRERIDLLRQEVEGRGMRWADAEVEDKRESGDGERNGDLVMVNGGGAHELNGTGETVAGEANGSVPRAPSGRLTDAQLREQMESMLGNAADEEEGVHL